MSLPANVRLHRGRNETISRSNVMTVVDVGSTPCLLSSRNTLKFSSTIRYVDVW